MLRPGELVDRVRDALKAFRWIQLHSSGGYVCDEQLIRSLLKDIRLKVEAGELD